MIIDSTWLNILNPGCVGGEGCCAIDWQWTGPGLGATDVIYLFMGSVEDQIVDDYKLLALKVSSYSKP